MDGTDLETIAEIVRERAPDIDVYVTRNENTSFRTAKKAANSCLGRWIIWASAEVAVDFSRRWPS